MATDETLLIFYQPGCPFCEQAKQLIDGAVARQPKYRDLKVETIDETVESARADSYDYYFVPTFYLGRTKLHEGAVDASTIDDVLARAYARQHRDGREASDAYDEASSS